MIDREEGVSPLSFLTEKPTRKYFELWVGAPRSDSSPGLQLQDRLGNVVNKGATDRKWCIGDGETQIYHEYERDFEEAYDVYEGVLGRYLTRRDRHFNYQETRSGTPPAAIWASVERISDGEVVLHSSADSPAEVEETSDFWRMIHSYPNQFL